MQACRPLALLLAAAILALDLAQPAQADATRLPELGPPAGDALPVHEERELGARVMEQLRAQVELSNDPEINEYVQRLGQRLAAHTDQPAFGYSFFVVEDDEINAFALPGGHVGVHTGLIRETRNESELAGVLAHEIGHVSQRHIARRFAQSQQLNLQTAAAILASVLVGTQNPQAGSAAAMAGLAAPMQQALAHSREHEREADRVAVHNLAAAGLDPSGMAAFLERLAEVSRYADKPPEYLQTHPLTQARITDAQSIAARYGEGDVFVSGHHPFIRARATVLGEARTGTTSPVALMRDRLERSADDPTARAAALYGLALALAREEGAYAQALALLDTLEATDGERLYVLLGRAEIQREAGRVDAALETYEEARSLYPGSEAAVFRHAETLLAAGDPGQARQELARATRNQGRSPQLLRLLADAAHRSGREAEGYIALAEHHYARGNLDLAIAQLNNAIRQADGERYQHARARALRERWQEERGD